MKRTVLFLVAVLVFLGTTSVFGAPRLTIPESIFDFGIVPQNSSISHVFWLHSTGDDTLRIINVKPG